MTDNLSMPTCGRTIYWLVFSLLGLAVVVVHSAAMTVDSPLFTLDMLLKSRVLLYAVLAVFMMTAVSIIDLRQLSIVKWYANPIHYVLLLAIILCIFVLIPGFGANINGSSRWLKIGSGAMAITFQPSELLKWIMIPIIGWWCIQRGQQMHLFLKGLLPPILLLGFCCAIVAVEDLGTAVLMGTVGMVLLVAGGARLWQLCLFIPPALGAFVALVIAEPYRINRLLAFQDPFADPSKLGYHPIQSMIAIYGGADPRGLGGSLQKHGYLPADTTDFIFPVMVEELGMWAGMMLIAAFALLVIVCAKIIMNTTSVFNRLFVLGVMLTIALQAVINMAVVTVLVPTKGIALPFISRGGTGWVFTAMMLGLVIAVDRLNHVKASQPKQPITNDTATDEEEIEQVEPGEESESPAKALWDRSIVYRD